MQSPLAYTIAAALVILALQRGDGVSARGMASNPDVAGGPASVVLRIQKEDALTRGHIAELQRGSAIARELFARVANMPSTILILRAAPALASQAHVYGRSRFWTNRGDTVRSHPVSSAAAAQLRDGMSHRPRTGARAGNRRRRSWWRHGRTAYVRALPRHRDWDHTISDGSETEFPQQVALAVLFELLGKRAHSNTLEALAHDHGITLPPADAGASKLSEVALQ